MNKAKRSKADSRTKGYADHIMDHPSAVLIVAVLAILMGILFIVSQRANKPIPRAEAVSYSGAFEKYVASRKYCEIHFKDGSCYEVYPHTESREFREKMESLEKGTKLYLLVNPNNDYVAEIRTETEELLNFELSQQEIDSYDNGYIAIGLVACVGGVFLIVYVIGSTNYKRKEEARHASRKAKGGNATALRPANTAAKSKILLEANVKGYAICYRRVRFVNELVVNGQVYDEKKGLFEFAHRLCATIDGHRVEAGYDNESYSYITFDGTVIQRKKRWL